MPSLKRCFSLALASAALVLALAAGSSLRAQGKDRIPITPQDSPLTRDPTKPSAYDYEIEQQSAVVGREVERALRAGNEAAAAKPPRYADAEKSYREALKLNPKEARAYVGLGRVFFAQERAGEAAAAFKRAIELKPKLAEAYFNLGIIYLATGRRDDALEQQRALEKLDASLARRLKQFIDKPPAP